jgi:tetratricopeptide (TPR) repeat protein
MRALLLLAITGWTLFAADGVREGREGNAHYRAGAYAAAVRAYETALTERDPQAASPLTSALWNNLGLALHRADSTQKAVAAFQNAFATAPAAPAQARAAYNAGTAAAQASHDEAALGRLRQALLADPSHEAARFNFELVKRQLERKKKKQQQKQQKRQPPPDVQPSPFAERLKTRADSLVARRRYTDAYRLMTQGLQRDSTVRAYRPFIQRTATVAQIDTLASAP